MADPNKTSTSTARDIYPSPANGEQDQGIYFNSAESDHSAFKETPDDESIEHSNSPVLSALKTDALNKIGQRRRSSAPNQPAVNLRRAQGYSKDNEMARNVGA